MDNIDWKKEPERMRDKLEEGRSTFIIGFLAEIGGMDGSIFPPRRPSQPEDRVVGVATEYERRIYCLDQQCQREEERMTVEYKYSAESERGGMSAQIMEFHYKHELCKWLFWACVRNRLQGWMFAHLELRNDWKIVETPEESRAPRLTGIDISGFFR